VADEWLSPGTCGVKLREFEQLTRLMTRSGPELRDLAHQLWQALSGAGASTAPAMEILRIAEWAEQRSVELQRRNVLAHNLDREKPGFSICTQQGTYLILPDRYTDQVAYTDGRRTAELVRRAAQGDQQALAELRDLKPEALTPHFAQGLLSELGPRELLTIPITLASRLPAPDSPDLTSSARDTRAVLALLGRSLVLGTSPNKPGFVGHDYLTQLTEAGRTTFRPFGTHPPNGVAGYQALSTLLSTVRGERLSPTFLQVVGSDMIAYERDEGLTARLLPDLSGEFHLGDALNPATPGGKDYLIPLLLAAAQSGRTGAQTLLSPQVGAVSNLRYLLHDRRPLYAQTDHGDALGQLIKTATSGRDAESERLALQAGRILAADARKYFMVEKDKLTTADKPNLDAFSALRPHMAEVFANHIAKVNDIYSAAWSQDHRPQHPLMTNADLDHLWLEIARDSNAFKTLLVAQIAHARVNIEQTVDNPDALLNTAITEAEVLGHLLEARSQSVGAATNHLEKVNGELKQLLELGVGTLTFSGSSRFGAAGLAAQALVINQAKKQLTDYLAKRLAEQPDPTIFTPQSNTEAVDNLLTFMIVTARVKHGEYPRTELADRPFVKPGTKEIRPLHTLTDEEFQDFISWATVNMELPRLRANVGVATTQGANYTAGHYEDSRGHNVLPSMQK
jgi:hypothetical protein